ncbi:MAG: alpha-L-rhamnosidase C-terminal domain-containing protein [Planctomycetota bacterium]
MTHHRDAIAAAEWQPPDSGWGADDVGVLIVPEVPDGSCYALTVGLSLPGVGEVLIEADGCQGGEVLDVLYAETIDGFGRPVFANTLSPGGDAVDVCTSVVLGGGGCRHEAFQITGHRYATVVVTGPSPALRLRLMHRQTRYPLDIVGRFDCDDPALMQTYHVSVNTQRNCMLDAYVDTPWREQAQWWGDARVQAWNTFSLKDDPRLLQRGIRQIADPQQSVPNGLTYGHAPTIAHNCVLPDFTCVWILTVWDHFFQTGEPNVFLEQAARIDSAIGYFESFGIGQGNLAAADPRYWLFLDWTDGIPREGQPTLLNMMLLEALERVGSLVQVSGYRGPLERVETLAQTLRGTITDRLWDEEVGAFHDGLGEQGQPYRSWSLHSQVQAVLCSLRSDVHEKTAREWVGAYLSGGPSGAAVPTPFWLVYVYEAARRLGLAQEAVDHMASYYAPMVASCGTWERSDRPGNGDVTGSHAWSAHPIYHLPRLLGGIVQLEPGWSKIRFDPLVNVKRCRRVSTLVPTPRGSIASTWERDGSRVNVRLELPTGIEAEAVLTGQRTEVVIGVSNWCVELSGTGVNTP